MSSQRSSIGRTIESHDEPYIRDLITGALKYAVGR